MVIDRHDNDNNRTWVALSDWNVNMAQVAESCFIGPQGEIMELVGEFNRIARMYMPETTAAIGVTKKFYWKRGSYNNVKDVYTNKINRFHEKPRGMHNLRDRINNNSYSARGFWDQLVDIDQKMALLRSQNFQWLDNTETVQNYINNLKHNVAEAIEIQAVNYPNIDVEVYIDTTDGDISNKLILLIKIKNISIKVRHDNEIIGNVPTNDITLVERINLWSHVNNHCTSEAPFENRRPNHSGVNSHGWFEDEYELSHPFVGRRYRGWRDNRNYGGANLWNNICKGDHAATWDTALWNMNIEVILHYANIWANNYDIPSTNPLNRIKTCFYGLPEGVDERVLTIPSSSGLGPVALVQQHWQDCSFPNRYTSILNNLAGPDGWKSTDRRQDYIAQLPNHCDNCQLKESGCTKALDLSLYPFQSDGIIESHWNDSDYHGGLSDIPFIRQQITIEMAAQSFMRHGPFHSTLRELNLSKDYCFSMIDEVLITAQNNGELRHIGYSFDYWYLQTELDNRNTSTDLLLQRWGAVTGDLVGTWEELREEYCEFHLGFDWDERTSENEEDFHHETDGLTTEDLYHEIANLREIADRDGEPRCFTPREPVIEVVIEEEQLSVEDRAIRWAAQRGGAIDFGQLNDN